MKTTILTGIFGVAILAGPVHAAHADYICTSYDGGSHLEVHHVTGQRLDAEVLLEKDGEQITFGALLLPSADEGILYKKHEYKLFAYQEANAKLTVISRQIFGRGGCGRGGCEGGAKVITANLDQQGSETAFSCHEESN